MEVVHGHALLLPIVVLVLNAVLNRTSLALLVVVTTAIVYFSYLNGQSMVGSVSFALGAGALYGAASGWVWVVSVVQHKMLRHAIKAAIVATFALLWGQLINTHGNWLRYTTQFGGMVVTQSVLFHLLKIQNWLPRLRGIESNQDNRATRQSVQFEILDILLVTTGYALLLGLAGLYRPQVGPDDYWKVVIGLWIFFPMLATITAGSSRFRSKFISTLRVGLLFTLAIGGSFALALMDVNLTNPNGTDLNRYFTLYSLITLGYVVSVGGFAFIGTLGRLTRV